MCFAGSVFGLLQDRQCRPTNSELIEGAKQMHSELGFSEQKINSLADVKNV